MHAAYVLIMMKVAIKNNKQKKHIAFWRKPERTRNVSTTRRRFRSRGVTSDHMTSPPDHMTSLPIAGFHPAIARGQLYFDLRLEHGDEGEDGDPHQEADVLQHEATKRSSRLQHADHLRHLQSPAMRGRTHAYGSLKIVNIYESVQRVLFYCPPQKRTIKCWFVVGD